MSPQKEERLTALQRQAVRLERRVRRLDARSNRYSWIRLAIFASGMLASLLLGIALHWWLSIGGVVLTALVFALVARQHRRIESSLARHSALLRWTHSAIARIRLDWQHIPPLPAGVGTEADATHAFDLDLDISGPRSLLRLVNMAISREGTRRLRSWLLAGAPDLATLRKRQALVSELARRRLFRTRLFIEANLASAVTPASAGLPGGQATVWLGERLLERLEREKPAPQLRTSVTIAALLNGLTLLLLAGSLLLGWPGWWLATALLSLLFFLTRRGDAGGGELFSQTLELQVVCTQLSATFAYLERWSFRGAPHLQQLCAPFRDRALSPARALRRLSLLLSAAALGQNPLLLIALHLILPWEFIIALRLEAWKRQLATHLPLWLDTWSELEVLSSLATFADLNPDYTFPEIAEDPREEEALFVAEGLGHPLLPPDSKVVNDLALRQAGEIIIITGSNMAGKSTFLRTVGVNICLAFAGAPVNARRLRLRRLSLLACIRVTDALTEGYSYFYAEVRRLRTLLDEVERAREIPVLFLIDEIFRGTNNRERRIGSRAYLRTLAGRRCVGLVATHDLDLTQLAEEVPEISNAHFREEVRDGQMVFDYRLRPGPCPTTNALQIMRLLGLPVE